MMHLPIGDCSGKCLRVLPGLPAFWTLFSSRESLSTLWERNAERTEDQEKIARDGNGAER